MLMYYESLITLRCIDKDGQVTVVSREDVQEDRPNVSEL